MELLYFANKFVSADKCVYLLLRLLMFNNKIANVNTDDAIDPDILENYPRNLDISYYRFMFNNKVSIISNLDVDNSGIPKTKISKLPYRSKNNIVEKTSLIDTATSFADDTATTCENEISTTCKNEIATANENDTTTATTYEDATATTSEIATTYEEIENTKHPELYECIRRTPSPVLNTIVTNASTNIMNEPNYRKRKENDRNRIKTYFFIFYFMCFVSIMVALGTTVVLIVRQSNQNGYNNTSIIVNNDSTPTLSHH